MADDNFDDLDEGVDPGDDDTTALEDADEDEAAAQRDGYELGPKTVSLVFLGIQDGDLLPVIEAVIEDAVKRGLWLFHASVDDIAPDVWENGLRPVLFNRDN